MAGRRKVSSEPLSLEPSGLPVYPPEKPQRVREVLAQGLYCLLANYFQDGDSCTDEETEWAFEALDWLRWNGGAAKGRKLAEGRVLISDAPKRAEI